MHVKFTLFFLVSGLVIPLGQNHYSLVPALKMFLEEGLGKCRAVFANLVSRDPQTDHVVAPPPKTLSCFDRQQLDLFFVPPPLVVSTHLLYSLIGCLSEPIVFRSAFRIFLYSCIFVIPCAIDPPH